MTPVELAQLRDRVARARLVRAPNPGYHHSWPKDRLDAAEDALTALSRGEGRIRRRRCVYCGTQTRSMREPVTCKDHRDLPSLDPFYMQELEEAA